MGNGTTLYLQPLVFDRVMTNAPPTYPRLLTGLKGTLRHVPVTNLVRDLPQTLVLHRYPSVIQPVRTVCHLRKTLSKYVFETHEAKM